MSDGVWNKNHTVVLSGQEVHGIMEALRVALRQYKENIPPYGDERIEQGRQTYLKLIEVVGYDMVDADAEDGLPTPI